MRFALGDAVSASALAPQQCRSRKRYNESRSDDRVAGYVMPLTLRREAPGRGDPDEKKRADAIRNEGSRDRGANEQ